jgi:uncharacterized membrane protein
MDTTSAAQYRTDQQDNSNGLVVAGWVCCFLLTPVGFIIAIILTAKGRWGHGVAMMVACVVYWLVIFTVLGAVAATEATDALDEYDAYNACVQQAETVAQMEKC